jgi:hypothetical protein
MLHVVLNGLSLQGWSVSLLLDPRLRVDVLTSGGLCQIFGDPKKVAHPVVNAHFPDGSRSNSAQADRRINLALARQPASVGRKQQSDSRDDCDPAVHCPSNLSGHKAAGLRKLAAGP